MVESPCIPDKTVNVQEDVNYKDQCRGQVPYLCGKDTPQQGKCRRTHTDCLFQHPGKTTANNWQYSAGDEHYLSLCLKSQQKSHEKKMQLRNDLFAQFQKNLLACLDKSKGDLTEAAAGGYKKRTKKTKSKRRKQTKAKAKKAKAKRRTRRNRRR